MQILKLMEYNHYLRHSYLDVFNQLPWDEFVKSRGASVDSLRDIFLHCIERMDRLVSQTIRGHAELPRINYNDYENMNKVNAYLRRVETDVNQYLSNVTSEELSRELTLKYPDGTKVPVTVEDALLDCFQEEIHHRGEFIAILWQMGIEPPHLGWVRYINKCTATQACTL